MKTRYKIRRVRNEDGTKSPWWTIDIYKNGSLFDESQTQYSSFWVVFKIWIMTTISYI